MSDIENSEAVEFAPEEADAVEPIEVIYTGECLSLSGRSTLTYEVGQHTEDGTLHHRISTNSGGGMFSKQWISASTLQDIFVGATDLNSKSFQSAFGQTSVNTAGFCLSSLKQLGLIEVDPNNARIHRHVAGAVYAKVVQARIAETAGQKSPRRKAKEG